MDKKVEKKMEWQLKEITVLKEGGLGEECRSVGC
jgi:hypothetical protein